MKSLRFSVAGGDLVICRLPADAPVPAWAAQGSFSSLTRTREELSVVCAEPQLPAEVQRSARYLLLKLHGPFALTETGVLSAFVAPLAEAAIPVFVLSTFDTDYVLVPEELRGEALRALQAAGHVLADQTRP